MTKYKIKERREKLGITQAELIRRSGLSKALISPLENGAEMDLKISTLKKLAEALECSPKSLFM